MVQLDVLPVGTRELEFAARHEARRDAADSRDARLGFVAGSRARAPVSPLLSPAFVAELVGFWMRHDGDRGAHTFDPIFWALDLGQPISVDGNATDLNPETHPIACLVRYEFPARGSMPPVTLTWYDGLRPPRPTEIGGDDALGNPEGGALFKGSEGLLTCDVYGENPRLLPASRMKDFTPPEPSIPRVDCTHEEDWLRAIRTGSKAGADFSYSGPLTEVCLLGNIAKRMGTKLEWDAVAMQFPNLPEANQYVRREYRDGWAL
jgi:hypothetical protein